METPEGVLSTKTQKNFQRGSAYYTRGKTFLSSVLKRGNAPKSAIGIRIEIGIGIHHTSFTTKLLIALNTLIGNPRIADCDRILAQPDGDRLSLPAHPTACFTAVHARKLRLGKADPGTGAGTGTSTSTCARELRTHASHPQQRKKPAQRAPRFKKPSSEAPRPDSGLPVYQPCSTTQSTSSPTLRTRFWA